MRQAERFLAHVGKPLAEVRLGDVQAFVASLEHQAPATRANAIADVKSFLTFARRWHSLATMQAKADENCRDIH